MLKNVCFNSFKSFVDSTTISLEKSKLKILENTNTSKNLLKGCAFYGSNASGKTSAINAISLLLNLLFINSKINIGPSVSLFSPNNEASFEYTFQIDGNEIKYNFTFNKDNKIISENLYLNAAICLSRSENHAESNITENKHYEKDDIDEQTLFLRNIYFNTKFVNYPQLAKWFTFLSNSIYINPSRNDSKTIGFNNLNNQNINLPDYLEKNGEEEINKFLIEFNFPYTITYKKTNKGDLQSLLSFPLRLSFKRKNLAPIPFFMESYGNQVLLNILPAILTSIKKQSMLIIDEFSSGLHNKLEELLVKYFFKNTIDGQLFFVSHSTNLLKTSLLRPDQIYSVDFNDNGSFLKKFSEENPRESQNLEKMYLSGVFGGIPIYE